MAKGKMNQAQLEESLRATLARNNQILAIMKRVEEMPIPEGKSALEVLNEELEAAGLTGVLNENS